MPKVLRVKFLRSAELFCFRCICKFDSLENPTETITSLRELSFRFRRFRYKWKNWFPWTMAAAEKLWRWVRFELILTMRDIYINLNLNPLTKFPSSNRSTEFKNILPWNISQMTMKTIPICRKIVISHAVKQGIPFWVYWKVNGNWDSNMIRIFQWRESHCRTNNSVRRNK